MKLKEVKGKLEYNRTKLQVIFEDFVESGMAQAEVIPDPDEYQSAHSLYSSLYGGVMKWTGGKAKVVMHGGRVYLVRTDR